jgi:hypothetical protein
LFPVVIWTDFPILLVHGPLWHLKCTCYVTGLVFPRVVWTALAMSLG